MNDEDQDEQRGGGIGPALALWGPLLLILFLIFIFWGQRDDTPGTSPVPQETPETAAPAGGEEQGTVSPQAPGSAEAARSAAQPAGTEWQPPASEPPSDTPAASGRTVVAPSGAQGERAVAIAPQTAAPTPSAPQGGIAPPAEGDPGAYYWGPAPPTQAEPPAGFTAPAYPSPPPPPGAGPYPPPPPGYGPGYGMHGAPWGYGPPPPPARGPGMGPTGPGGYAYGPPPGYGPWHAPPPPGYPPPPMGPWAWGYPPPPGYAPPGYGVPEYAFPQNPGARGDSPE